MMGRDGDRTSSGGTTQTHTDRAGAKMATRVEQDSKLVNSTPGVQPRPAFKKPYVKPAFRYERVFETMALSCGKLNPNQFQCRFNQKTS
jgi:hypothetical protein